MNNVEWEWMKTRLYDGCTFTYRSTPPAHGVIFNGKAKFDNFNFVSEWNISTYGGLHLRALSNFKWPDGTDVEYFTEWKEMANSTPVLRKIKSLDGRFKNKSLPKCTQKALPFPS